MVSRGALAIGALWVVGAVAATSVGLVAVHLVSREVGNQAAAPLTGTGVDQALSSVSPTAPTEDGGSQEPAETVGDVRTITTTGGVVSARCATARPTLLYATPGDGYRTERSSTASRLQVSFIGRGRKVTVTMSCQDDHVRAVTRTSALTTATSSPRPAPAPSETPEREPSGGSTTDDHSGGADH